MGNNGMDGGLWGIKAFGGGRFQFEICQQHKCCQTSNLDTEDDNWEKYEVNYFVGKQLKAKICLTEDKICQIDIVSRCFENKNNNCCEPKFVKMPFVY